MSRFPHTVFNAAPILRAAPVFIFRISSIHLPGTSPV